ncbi:MAG: hypothetical protein JWQ98_3660 [Chlorobi bacterium]|nr:hypothetical protein [Chlorobiota bacterium]
MDGFEFDIMNGNMEVGMKIPMTLALAICVSLLAGCQARTDVSTPGTADSTAGTTAQIEKIAGDKTMMADIMKRAYEKGTFDDALAMAMGDSSFAGKVFDVVARDARFAVMARDTSRSAVAGSRTVVRSAAPVRVQSRTTAQRSSGDALDKTENAVKKANEKLDQANRVRDQIDEARRKAGQILHP